MKHKREDLERICQYVAEGDSSSSCLLYIVFTPPNDLREATAYRR